MSDKILKIRNLSISLPKNADRDFAVKNANLDVSKGEILFIDATQLGSMKNRVERVLTDEDISQITNTVNSWRKEEGYENVSGFCYKAKFEEIEKNGFVLTPGTYVGAPEEEEDSEPFEEKMKRLTVLLKEQQNEGIKLDEQIAKNLKRIGYEF